MYRLNKMEYGTIFYEVVQLYGHIYHLSDENRPKLLLLFQFSFNSYETNQSNTTKMIKILIEEILIIATNIGISIVVVLIEFIFE